MVKSLIADACISRRVVDGLRERGIDVLYVNEMHNPSMPDSEIMNLGYSLKEPIVTHDHDFEQYAYVILLPARKSVEKTIKETLRYLE